MYIKEVVMDLKTAFKEKGIRSTEVMYVLNISHTSYFNKLNGKTLWTNVERKKLQKILDCSYEEIKTLIPSVRFIPKKLYPEHKALAFEFSKRNINLSQYAEEELHISPIVMARKMNGRYAFTEEQKEKIRATLDVSKAEIDLLIPLGEQLEEMEERRNG